MNIILRILFFTITNMKINFLELKIPERTYVLTETISITNQVKLVAKKEFAAKALDSK